MFEGESGGRESFNEDPSTLVATWRLVWGGKQWGRDRYQESVTVVLIQNKSGPNQAEKGWRHLKLET